ncbi:SDR family NAD(P)-dependent oxidoreductase, partial [Comamonas aquatica]
MSNHKVWFITGAGRGLGVELTKAALAAGHTVVATGRNSAKVAAALGAHPNLLCLKLDVTRLDEAQAAVAAAVARFGRIDVLVNNAGNFYAGFFEELNPEQVRSQLETLLFGPMNVTRAVLPTMRGQRAGLLLNISSTAGITGGMFCS